MDLLFSRYASPFLLCDETIKNGMFGDFVLEFMKQDDENRTWEFYLHKVFDKSFDEFKESIRSSVADEKITKEQLEVTVINSKNTLNNFIPN